MTIRASGASASQRKNWVRGVGHGETIAEQAALGKRKLPRGDLRFDNFCPNP